jgi:tetratricopeptide (TPR) repeat protein
MNQEQQDKFYKKMGANVHNDPSRFKAIAELCKGSVLDIGCGAGDLASYYEDQYTGFDQSQIAIDMAENLERKNADFYCADCFQFINDTIIDYDTVVMAEFLEHIKDWDDFIEKLVSRLSDNNRLIISVPNGNRIPDDDHVNEFTVPQLRRHFSQYGRVKFHNWFGFKGRILMTVDLGQKSPDKLTLGMFCKNEAKGIEAAVLSCIEFVDEIVILVDSSSSDESLEVARRYGDISQKFKWDDSFSKARNLVQKLSKSEWILCLDGHEFVKEAPNLNDKLEFPGDGLMIKVRLEEGFTFDFPRIVRREVIWDRDVHNNANCKKVIPYSDFLIQHDRKNNQAKEAIEIRTKQRTQMIENVMYEEMKKDKKNTRPYFYLGELYFNNQQFKKAIKFWKKYLKYGTHKGERWLVTYNIAMAYNYRMFFPIALHWLKKAEKEFPNRWEIQKALGLTYLTLFEYEEALEYFVNSLQETKGHFNYSPMEFNNVDTWDKIAMCFRRLDRLPEALMALERCLELSKNKELSERLKQRIRLSKKYLASFPFTSAGNKMEDVTDLVKKNHNCIFNKS